MAKRELPGIPGYLNASGNFELDAEEAEYTPQGALYRGKRAKTGGATAEKKTRRKATERPSVRCTQHWPRAAPVGALPTRMPEPFRTAPPPGGP